MWILGILFVLLIGAFIVKAIAGDDSEKAKTAGVLVAGGFVLVLALAFFGFAVK